MPLPNWPYGPCGNFMVLVNNSFYMGVYQEHICFLGRTPVSYVLYNLWFSMWMMHQSIFLLISGQTCLRTTNHILLYLFLLIVVFSGMLKKFFIEEPINLFFFEIQSSKTIFELSNAFYQLHWLSSIILVSLVLLHILAAMYNHMILKQKILKKIT